ncbi:MAG: metallophosphoesterase [Bacteroidales bacterium]|nr:metallophosphoesterase [Bacteroidales bacterium]
MKTGIIVILGATLLGVLYVIWHLWRITPGGWTAKLLVTGLFLLWMAAAFASMLLRKQASISTITALYELGHPWMIAFLYLLIVFVVADLGILVRLIPKGWLIDNAITLVGILGVIAVVLTAGGIHYRHKYREELTIRTEKPLGKSLTIVFASDLHIGYSNRKDELGRWVDLINAEEPDLVLFAGDIMDIQLRPLVAGNYAESFHRLTAPAFTVLGNHEYIGGEADAERFLKEAGICLLRDSVVRAKGITIIGRDDRSNTHRKRLSELVDSSSDFSILLDHQPSHLEEAEASGIDFQFSGHTHRGQVWPLNWLTDALFEKSWGYYKRGNTQYYVSSGLGIWGPKIRIGTRSEYLVLHIEPCTP